MHPISWACRYAGLSVPAVVCALHEHILKCDHRNCIVAGFLWHPSPVEGHTSGSPELGVSAFTTNYGTEGAVTALECLAFPLV